jgi:hypothetical protein
VRTSDIDRTLSLSDIPNPQFEVFLAIVSSVSVLVVHTLAGAKRPTEHSFEYNPVFGFVPFRGQHVGVSGCVDVTRPVSSSPQSTANLFSPVFSTKRKGKRFTFSARHLARAITARIFAYSHGLIISQKVYSNRSNRPQRPYVS